MGPSTLLIKVHNITIPNYKVEDGCERARTTPESNPPSPYPRDKLSKMKHICTPLTVQGTTGQEAAGVTHAASPLSRPANKRLAAEEIASDDAQLKTA